MEKKSLRNFFNIKKILGYIIFNTVRIDRKVIVFDHFNGLDVGCNPGSIAKEILDKYPEYKVKWILSKNNRSDSRHIRGVDYVSNYFLSKCIAMASAKVVVFNTLNAMADYKKKKGQIWIQTGHGSFGIKKIGIDLDKNRIELIKKEAKKTNIFLSNSKFESNVFMSGFMLGKNKIIEAGHARNDIFFDSNKIENTKNIINNKYGIGDAKIIMFAPTHSKGDISFISSLNINLLLGEMNKKFGGRWVFGLRLHPRTFNKIRKNKKFTDKFKKENIIELSDYPDMQDLLVSVDAMITDYSSGIFDFLLSKRPCFFYENKKFKKNLEKSFYYKFNETPISVAYDSYELAENIRDFNHEVFSDSIELFLNTLGSIEDGMSSKRAAEIIKYATEGYPIHWIKNNAILRNKE